MIIGTSCLLFKKESFIGGVVLHNVLGICAILLLILTLTYISLKMNWIKFLTHNATYIYLYQFCVMSLVTKIYTYFDRDIDGMYVCVVVLFTIIVAVLIRIFNSKIKNIFRSE